MVHLSLTFLGSFQTTIDHKPITHFRSARVQGLMVYLVLKSEQPHDRDVLAALFWPDESDSVARKNLRQSLYQLRQVLGETDSREEPYLLVTRSTVQFNPSSDHSLDVADFLTFLENDQLEKAVDLYRGGLLPGFTCDSLPFEEWLREQRELLHRRALEALHTLSARSLARGDYRSTQTYAQRQLALEPWREEAHRQLMQAFALLGERSTALAQYETCRELLGEELGVEPTQETQALMARIRDQSLEGEVKPELLGPLERRRLSIPFVGRESEHSALVGAYQQVHRDGFQVVALVGEAGIGKTRLVRNFLDWAAMQDADMLRGQALETSRRLSYQPLTQALRQRLERENAPEDLLSDLWLTQLTRILPELRDRYPDLPAPTRDEATAREHLFEAITRLGVALAERAPLIMFIDDWHWADAGSLDVLHYAALRWAEERMPILVILTIRQEALTESPELGTWLTRLKHDVVCVQLNLEPLSGAETEQMLQALLEMGRGGGGVSPEGEQPSLRVAQLSSWLFAETDGQPFFLVETLKALVEAGLIHPDKASGAWLVDWEKLDVQLLESGSPVLPGVRELILGWLERISDPAAELLAAAAALSEGVSFDRLYRVAGLEQAQALTALDELLIRGLLLEEDRDSRHSDDEVTYVFSHQKLREVVYNQSGAARRKILHRRAFEVLDETTASAAELARHAHHAGLPAEAIRYSLAAGSQAMRLFTARVAIDHYESAWQWAERVGWPKTISGADRQDLYVNLGRAYELTDAWDRAQAIYQAMIDDAQKIGASAMHCMGLNRMATVVINGFKDPHRAVALLEQARVVAEQSGDRPGLAETQWNLSVAARLAEQSYQALDHGERALTIARQLEHPQLLARCLNSLAYIHARLRHWDTVEAYANEARQLYAGVGNQILEADSQRVAGWAQIYLGRPGDSLATLQETFVFSQRIENLWGQAECAWRLALTMLELGRYGEAIRLSRQAVDHARSVGQPTMVVMALTTRGAVQRTVMQLGAARETLLEVLAESDQKGSSVFLDWVLSELCALHAICGDWDQAHHYARRGLEFHADEPLLPMGFTGWYETEALLRGGEGDRVGAEAERLSEIVGDHRRYQVSLLRSQAVLSQWDNDLNQAINRLEAASDLAQEIGLPGEEWSILSVLSGLYDDLGDRDRARCAREASSKIILSLAESIDEGDIRAGFLAAEHVRDVLDDD